MPVFTEHQKKALDVQRHLSVTANAGAGKTAVLVERFLDILLAGNVRVQEIVAITFTEKAAGELRRKIAEALEKRMQSVSAKKERTVLEQIRGNLASAVIGTIHSFCAQMLREFPVEANIDAAFTILEGVDRRMLLEESIRETFESVMREGNSDEAREKFLDLVKMFGRTRVQRYLSTLLEKREQVERIASTCFGEKQTDDEILDRWNALLTKEVLRYLDDPRWRNALLHIIPLAEGKNAAIVKESLDQWNDKLPPAGKIDLYKTIAESVFTKKNEFLKKFSGTGVDLSGVDDADILTRHHADVGKLLECMSDESSVSANRSLIKLTRTLLSLWETCLGIYEARKAEYGQLDFDDLQLKAHRLLLQEEIQVKLRLKYKYIMVDEFQDTNRLQYEILAALVVGFGTGNLFIVGDPKQSIYGFRNAEVEVFEEAKAAIVGSAGIELPFQWNDQEISSSQEERKGSITLAESFRLLPNIAMFVNKVFGKIMGGKRSRFDVRYDEIVKARKTDGAGEVELLIIPHHNDADDDTDDPDTEIMEARAIAGRIAELSNTGHKIYDRHESLREFSFGDVAILLRTRLHVHAIEQALREYNIPYLLSGGIGYYQTQEVLDFCNYFKFLLNQQDDVALAGILRSPFFAISDAELYEISLIGGEGSFWEKMRQFVVRQEGTVHLRHALQVLTDDITYAGRLSIPFLVQRIFRQTGWQGTAAGLASGRQLAANIQKLLRIARDFEEKGFTSLYSFVERLQTLIDEEEREGQAATEEAGDAVKVMTIHAAKGLEFPVVVLPFTHQKFGYDDQPFIEPEVGVAFKIRDEADYDKELTPALYYYLKHRSRLRTEAEEKRIFYVACTRARDMLILSGEHDVASKSPSYLSWTLQGLDVPSTEVHSEVKVYPAITGVPGDPGELNVSKGTMHDFAVIIRLLDRANVPRPVSRNSGADIGEPREIMVQALDAQTWGQFFSATHIKTYLECPTKYYLKYHLGLPEQQSAPYNFDENEEPNDKLFGEFIGTLTHSVLQSIQTMPASDTEVRQLVGAMIASDALVSESLRAAAAEQINQLVNSFIRSSFGREVLAAAEAKTEFSLNMLFGKDFLTGTIDRLYRDPKGNWNIVDYKTDQVSADGLQERSELYKPQLAFYALLVSRYAGQEDVDASLVFLRHPESPVHFHFDKSALEIFSREVQKIIRKVSSGEFERNVERCAMCTYRERDECMLPRGTHSDAAPAKVTNQLPF